jgi:hypothetical protein
MLTEKLLKFPPLLLAYVVGVHPSLDAGVKWCQNNCTHHKRLSVRLIKDHMRLSVCISRVNITSTGLVKTIRDFSE